MSRATAPDARSRTILIVDDMPANLGVLVDHLEGMGHRVLVAQGGEEALKRASFTRPDLILLDVLMPGIDGFETCRCLKAAESTRYIPVIFMTFSSARRPVRYAGRRAGAAHRQVVRVSRALIGA
jgi:CheY-like chemotaxis protein